MDRLDRGGGSDNEERELRDLTSAEVLVLYAVVSKEKGCLSSQTNKLPDVTLCDIWPVCLPW